MTGTRSGLILGMGGIAALAVSLVAGSAKSVTAAPGATSVTVVNSDSEPVPVRAVADRKPFQISGGGVVGTNGCAGNAFRIPADKRLVVEHVTLNAALPFDQERLFSLSITNGSTSEYVSHTIAARREPGKVFYTASEPLTAFGAPGTEACVAVQIVTGAGSFSVSYSLTGYLVNP